MRNVYDCYIKDLTNIKYVMGLSSAFSITKTSAKYYKIKLQAIRFYISVGSNTFISNAITVIITYCCKALIYRFANKFSKIFDHPHFSSVGGGNVHSSIRLDAT